MNQLVEFLTQPFLESKSKNIALIPGGYKPPTFGHFYLAQEIAKKQEVSEVLILIGHKVRDGINKEQSLKIWNIYKKHLPNNVKIKISDKTSPVGEVISIVKNNPQNFYLPIVGYRGEQDEGDLSRYNSLKGKYDNYKTIVYKSDYGVSGTKARKAIQTDSFENFQKYLPIELTPEDRLDIWDILKNKQLNENASYSKDINIQEKIDQLTQHMLDKGYNIKPLPNVEFVNGDSENAKDFFGKTAYYNPNTQTIVLYTEGRHPKDIVRSYSHEMIHHIQNIEDRLGNIQTTNTHENDELNKIEAEANLKGTMTFRNWTDSLNESLLPQEKFSKEMGRDYVKQALHNIPQKDKYNIKDYKVVTLPLDKIKPTQFGEDYINPSSKYEAEQYKKYLEGKISAEDLRKEDFYPIIVDKSTMEIIDGNHRHAVHTMLNIPKIKTILVSKNINEEKNKDPFRLNSYSMELGRLREKENPSPFPQDIEESILSDIKEYGDILEFKIDLKNTYQYPPDSNLWEFYDDINNVKIIAKLKSTVKNISEFKFYSLQDGKQLSFSKLKRHNPKVMNTIFKIFMDEVLPNNPKILIHPFDYLRYRLFRTMLNNNLDGNQYKIDTKDDPMGQSVLLVQKLNEAKKPYKHKHGFDDNLGKDPFGLNQFAREIVEEMTSNPNNIMEGRYDTITNQISGDVFNFWKSNINNKPIKLTKTYQHEGENIDVKALLKLTPNSDKLKIDGGADENNDFIKIIFTIDPSLLPEYWEKISMNLKDVVRHEIEHLTQGTGNLEKQGKHIEDDMFIRQMIDMELLPQSEYFKLKKEIDANLQGLYFKAKKQKLPFKDVVDEYLELQDIKPKEKSEIIDIWRERLPALNLPKF